MSPDLTASLIILQIVYGIIAPVRPTPWPGRAFITVIGYGFSSAIFTSSSGSLGCSVLAALEGSIGLDSTIYSSVAGTSFYSCSAYFSSGYSAS